MTVLEFVPRGREANGVWRQQEMQQLTILGSAHSMSAEVGGWACGATDAGDPQFYVLGPEPEENCLLCISRVDGMYLLEDGTGTLLAQNHQLKPVLHKAAGALTRRRMAGFALRGLFALCAVRTLIEQKLEPFLAETSEHLVRVAPQLAALV
jgi:hypothetical protein